MNADDVFTLLAAALLFIIPAVIIDGNLRRKEREKADQYNKPREYIPYAAPKPKPVQTKPTQKPVKQPVKAQINPETLKAMHKLADAERGIAEALERKMLHTPDPIKHARLEKQARNSWLRFNQILDKIDKLTMQ